MSTDINIRRTSRTVVDRAKEQQQAARAARLTQESTAKQTQENRDRILSDARTSAATRAALTGKPAADFTIPPPRSLISTRPDPAATRFPNILPYFILFAQNIETREWHDDIRLRVGEVSGQEVLVFPKKATANSFPVGGNIYLYLPSNYSLERFQESPAWQTVSKAKLAPDFSPLMDVTKIRNIYPSNQFYRQVKKLKDAQKKPPVITPVQFISIVEKRNDPNYFSYQGNCIFGFVDKKQHTLVGYAAIAGENIVSSVAWGSTNQDQFYYDGYLTDIGNEYFEFNNPPFQYFEFEEE